MSKTILITGTSTAFAKRHWNVVAIMRDTQKAAPEFGQYPNI
ncbi:hypothetical protein [Brevibacillus reuszeri]|nr:hypothetical protein [Brevibacillus reuszeri]